MNYNICRLCKDDSIERAMVRYGIRHYCHPECGFDRWGDEFLRMIPAHEIGCIPYRLLQTHARRALALELCPDTIKGTLSALPTTEVAND